MMSEEQSEIQSETQNSPQNPPKKRRWLRYTLGGLVLLCGATVGGATWLLNTESGLKFAVFKLPQYANIKITASQLSGSVLGGFLAQNLVVEMTSSDLAFSSLKLAWQPHELWNAHLHINELAVGDIHITTKPTPDTPSEPLQLPPSLDLPITVALDKLTVGKLTQNKQTDAYFKGASAQYFFDHLAHKIVIQSLTTHWSKSVGQLSLGAQSPFKLDGKVHSLGQLDDIDVVNDIRLSGSLKDIALNVDLEGKGVRLQADTKVHPFTQKFSEMIETVKVSGEGLNPKAFMPNLPQANLTFDLAVQPQGGAGQMLSGSLNLQNTKPIAADKNGIPIKNIASQFQVGDTGAIDIRQFDANLMQQGELAISGGIYPAKSTLNLTANIRHLTAEDAISQKIYGTINGKILASGTFTKPVFDWQLNTGLADVSGSLKLLPDAKNQQTLVLENGKITPKNGGEMDLSAQLQLFADQNLTAKIQTKSFNPAKLYPNLPEGNVNGNINVLGKIAKTAYQTELAFAPSTLSGAQLSGNGKVSYENNHLSRADLALKLGSNLINTQGAYGKKGDKLALDINAPQLNLFGFGLQGALSAKGYVQNTADSFAALDAQLDGQIRGFAFEKVLKIQTLDFTVHASPEPTRPMKIALIGKGINASGKAIEQADIKLDGTLRQHILQAQSRLKIDAKPLTVNLHANGGLNEKNQWIGNINTLNLAGALQLNLQNPMHLEAGAQRVSLSAARWQALNGSLNLERLTWDKSQGLTTKGSANGLHLAQLHNFYTPPVEHNLVIAADWDLAYSQSARGFLNVKQQSGDVILPNRKQPLGLKNLVLNTQLIGNEIQNKINAQTNIATVSGNYNITQRGGTFGNNLVSGRLKIDVADLNRSLKAFMPVGQIIQGNLQANVNVSGSVAVPKLGGTILGDKLYYRNRQVGVILDNGSLKSRLDGQTWLIDALEFKRKNGTITLSGSVAYLNNAPDVKAKLVFNRYPILDQPTRRLTLSGSSNVSYLADGVALSGSLKTDEARFTFQEGSAPTLDDDVYIIGEEKPAPSVPMPFKLNLNFDLANNFYFTGDGLNVNLGGQLQLTSKTTSDVQAVGSVKIVNGRYKAYGQDLVISKGVISFVGPLTKPNLNIRAERRASPVGAGVEVLGNLDAPRVSLVANEPMSEKDKLSWLILNRASSGSSGDNAALATAASAFLAGKLNDKIGLVDDFGLTSQQTRNAQTGEMNPAQQVLTFGKQINQQIYIGYEAGLQTASQTVKLVYQLSRSFQAIGKLGTVSSGVELKYIKRFD